MLKILSSVVSEDSDITHMPAVKSSAILEVCAYLALIEKSNYSRHPKEVQMVLKRGLTSVNCFG
jgi:hypothetical protein